MILVSKSPRREELLRKAGFKFRVVHPNWKEVLPASTNIEDIPVLIAEEKLRSVSDKFEDEILISADTIVVLGQEILGKPKNRGEALGMLQKLSGRWHKVISGIAIKHGRFFQSFRDITEVEFKLLSQGEIDHYIEQFKPYDKAGAYGIQEWIGLIGINRIRGSYYNVMGLPVHKVYDVLNKLNYK